MYGDNRIKLEVTTKTVFLEDEDLTKSYSKRKLLSQRRNSTVNSGPL